MLMFAIRNESIVIFVIKKRRAKQSNNNKIISCRVYKQKYARFLGFQNIGTAWFKDPAGNILSVLEER
jgi:uncharacterized membrane protein